MEKYTMELVSVDMITDGFELFFYNRESEISTSIKLKKTKFVDGKTVSDEATEKKYLDTLDTFFEGDPEGKVGEEFDIYMNFNNGKFYSSLYENNFIKTDALKDTNVKAGDMIDFILEDIDVDDKGIKLVLKNDKVTITDKDTNETRTAAVGKQLLYTKYNSKTKSYEQPDAGLKMMFINNVKDKLKIDIVATLDGKEVSPFDVGLSNISKVKFEVVDKDKLIGKTVQCLVEKTAMTYLKVLSVK